MKATRNLLQHRLGQVVRRHREAKKWTQEGFADHIAMHRAAYGFIEQGRRDVRLSTLERVANGLEEPMWAILKEAESS